MGSKAGKLNVGVAGFEPTTSWSQTRRDTGLRYTPKNKSMVDHPLFFSQFLRRAVCNFLGVDNPFDCCKGTPQRLSRQLLANNCGCKHYSWPKLRIAVSRLLATAAGEKAASLLGWPLWRQAPVHHVFSHDQGGHRSPRPVVVPSSRTFTAKQK